MDDKRLVHVNPWAHLKVHTPARIALGRVGTSIPTAAHLAFQAAHASARNAVQSELDVAQLAAALRERWGEPVVAHSCAHNRAMYLQRPDLGRRLQSREPLLAAGLPLSEGVDLAFVLMDGLSALAVERNAVPFLEKFSPYLEREPWRVAAPVIVTLGRVAAADEVAEVLGAKVVVVLVGERPGLSSPDSLGIYVTYGAHVGSTDVERNCISNVRAAGLSHAAAAYKLHYLVREAMLRKGSGVGLKDNTGTIAGTSLRPRAPG